MCAHPSMMRSAFLQSTLLSIGELLTGLSPNRVQVDDLKQVIEDDVAGKILTRSQSTGCGRSATYVSLCLTTKQVKPPAANPHG